VNTVEVAMPRNRAISPFNRLLPILLPHKTRVRWLYDTPNDAAASAIVSCWSVTTALNAALRSRGVTIYDRVIQTFVKA